VIADNCADATVRIARDLGVVAVETVGNTEKKAGALNQQLAMMLPDIEPRDVVMVMDADSTIGPDFLAVALGLLESNAGLVAVGGLFYGEDGAALIGQLQRNEFTRYQRVVARKLNRVFVLTGTASLIRGYALRAVAESRGQLIPGRSGQVYDTLALTEDNELTLALKSLGARMTSPPECRVTTEIMPSWRALWRQRLRWHRGALENISAYGLTRATAMYWGQQLGLAYGVFALYSYLLLMLVSLLAADQVRWSWFWVSIGFVFVANRLLTAWSAGWRGRLLAAPIVVELAYAVFLQACFMTSLVQIATGRQARWNYVPRPALQVVGAAAFLTGPLVPLGILLPTSTLQTEWFQALAVLVGINTLVFATLAVLEMLPPLRLPWRRLIPARHPGTD
jgi:cellulose synthase/poly-beta-1,6-N-acetylglucosamine synthase-like glycosyltransferase